MRNGVLTSYIVKFEDIYCTMTITLFMINFVLFHTILFTSIILSKRKTLNSNLKFILNHLSFILFQNVKTGEINKNELHRFDFV